MFRHFIQLYVPVNTQHPLTIHAAAQMSDLLNEPAVSGHNSYCGAARAKRIASTNMMPKTVTITANAMLRRRLR